MPINLHFNKNFDDINSIAKEHKVQRSACNRFTYNPVVKMVTGAVRIFNAIFKHTKGIYADKNISLSNRVWQHITQTSYNILRGLLELVPIVNILACRILDSYIVNKNEYITLTKQNPAVFYSIPLEDRTTTLMEVIVKSPKIFGDLKSSVESLLRVLKNDNVDKELLKKVAEDPEANIELLKAVIDNPLTDTGVLIAVASNRNADLKTLKSVNDKLTRINAPQDMVAKITNSINVIENKFIHIDALRNAINCEEIEPSSTVLTAIAKNHSADADILYKIVMHKNLNNETLYEVVKHDNSDPRTLVKAVDHRHSNSNILYMAARHHNAHNTIKNADGTDISALSVIAKNPSADYRALTAVAKNHHATASILNDVIQHKNSDHLVFFAVANNHNANQGVFNNIKERNRNIYLMEELPRIARNRGLIF